RMDDAVQAVPVLAEAAEHGVDFRIVGNVTGETQFLAAAEFLGGAFDAGFEFVVLVGEGEFGTFTVHGFGNTPGDGTLTGDTHDQIAFAGKKAHVSSSRCESVLSGMPGTARGIGWRQYSRP